MTAALQIVLCSDSPRRKQNWTDAIRELTCHVRTESEFAVGMAADLVITDRPLTSDQFAGRGEIGIIAVGVSTPADVLLPEDVTERELQLACSLLGQIVGLRRERSDEVRRRETLSHQVFTDSLTGLPNRRAYEAEVSRRLQSLARQERSLCLALVDLDQFKQVNDCDGHLEGDRTLVQAGVALGNSARSHDFIARLGGDEFVVLISNLAGDAAFQVIDRIRASVGRELADGPTASAGFVLVNQVVAEKLLFDAADRALRDAKSAGRDRTLQSSCEVP